MNREEFVKQLRDGLEIFTDDEKEKCVKHYTDLLDDAKSKNMSEEDCIKTFGTMDSIINKIYLEHGINPKKINHEKGFFYQKFEELFEAIHRVVDEMAKNSARENAKIIFDILFLIAFICIMKIPFIAVRSLVENLLTNLGNPIFDNIWVFIIEVLYIIFAIMAFMNIFTKWFKNLKSKETTPVVKEDLKNVKELDSVSLKDNQDK